MTSAPQTGTTRPGTTLSANEATAIPPGYKQTEVGVIPQDWESRRIDTVCRLINGRGFKPFEWQNPGLPIIRIQNLNGSDDFNFYTGAYDTKLEVEPGQLLFAWSGSRGTSFGPHIWHGPLGLLNYHTWKVQVHETEIRKEFLLHALRRLTTFIEGKAHGASALVHTQKWEMEGFQFPLPPTKAEQEAIAEALSDVDKLLGSLEKLIAKKRAIKQAAMQQLLTGKTRLPGFSPTEAVGWVHRKGVSSGYKQTELGLIPEDWQVRVIGQLASVARGASPRPIDSPVWFDSQSGTGWLRISDVTASGKFLDDTTQNLSAAGVASSRFVKSGNLVMSICATVGRPILTRKDVCIHDGFVVFDNLRADKEWLYYLLSNMETDWSKHGQTGSQMNLNTDLIDSTPVPLPPSTEQRAIATVISDMDAEITALDRRRDKTRAIKQSMMQQLLTGRVRLVKPASSQPLARETRG